MLFAGSDDGVYRFSDPDAAAGSAPEKVLDSGRVRRLYSFDDLEGVLAATHSGLFYSAGGEDWTDLGVPADRVYSAGLRPDGETLYAGTRPAHVYVAADLEAAPVGEELTWRKLDGFDDLPSRPEWRLPRHENLAQVRDVHVHPQAPDRVIAGVEVGGVHVSDDGGETWAERNDGAAHDDVHELLVRSPDEYVVATGYGLFRTADAGRTWTRLDEDVPQRYFRAVADVDGTVYAAGAMANSSTWEDDDADPQLFELTVDSSVTPVETPYPEETVTGMTAVDGDLVAATHRGHVVVMRSDGWEDVGQVPTPGGLTGTYNPVCWFER
jgi:photosystem II stability/assembly factor-like uncharacterized protein